MSFYAEYGTLSNLNKMEIIASAGLAGSIIGTILGVSRGVLECSGDFLHQLFCGGLYSVVGSVLGFGAGLAMGSIMVFIDKQGECNERINQK